MKLKAFLLTILMVLSYSGIAYAGEEITLTTYYPAPYGEYEGLAVGDPNNGYTAPADPIDLIVEGNVGIGTTGPVDNLHVKGGYRVATFEGDDYNQVNIRYPGNDWGMLLTNSDGTSNGGYHYSTSGNNNSVAVVNVNNDALHLGTNNAVKVTIDHNGDVGIGTAGPGYKLDVAGNTRLNNVFLGDVGHGSSWAGFAHYGSANTAGYGLLQRNDGLYTLINKKSGGGFIGFRVDNTDKMVILDNGNVGIGTTSPGANKLEVVGGPIKATSGLIIETRAANPPSPATGQMWLIE